MVSCGSAGRPQRKARRTTPHAVAAPRGSPPGAASARGRPLLQVRGARDRSRQRAARRGAPEAKQAALVAPARPEHHAARGDDVHNREAGRRREQQRRLRRPHAPPLQQRQLDRHERQAHRRKRNRRVQVRPVARAEGAPRGAPSPGGPRTPSCGPARQCTIPMHGLPELAPQLTRLAGAARQQALLCSNKHQTCQDRSAATSARGAATARGARGWRAPLVAAPGAKAVGEQHGGRAQQREGNHVLQRGAEAELQAAPAQQQRVRVQQRVQRQHRGRLGRRHAARGLPRACAGACRGAGALPCAHPKATLCVATEVRALCARQGGHACAESRRAEQPGSAAAAAFGQARQQRRCAALGSLTHGCRARLWYMPQLPHDQLSGSSRAYMTCSGNEAVLARQNVQAGTQRDGPRP